MKRIISAITAAALLYSSLFTFASAEVDASNPGTVSTAVSGYVSSTAGDIELASKVKTPDIYVDAENDYAGVIRAAGDLKSDIKAVTDVTANITDNADSAELIIGTIGKSDAIDALIANGTLDVSEIENQWEAFTVQNVDGTLVIAGADKRGTIYGIYDLSEKMGVSPWEWWADVVPAHSDALYVTLPENGYTESSSSVKYRGIFLNQEYNLWNWAKSLDGDIGIDTETYKKVFELLLRLKANYMWPAMHEYTQAFNVKPENARIADEYGIVMGTSHCEMLLRNNMGELLEFQQRWIAENPDKKLYMFNDNSLNAEVAYDYTDVDKDGNPVCNKEFIEDYWRERVRANKDYESNFTIGMRGVHDGAWNPVNAKTDEEKIALLEEIIAKQREILSEEIGKPAEEIPQTFIPYKEIADLYNKGLEVPDDVTIMFTNDNYGHVRQCMTSAEQTRSGGGGMYYHVSYYGRPSSVIWNGGTQLGLIKEEMTKAYDSGADTVWILNVGPLKGFENQTEYFLDLGRNIDKIRNTSVKAYVKDNAKRYFSFNDEEAREYADIQCEFLELANSRRPDFMTQGVYSITSCGDEGQIVLDRYDSLLKRSEALYNSLPQDKQPSFYELQLYAVKSANNIVQTFINADKASLYKEQGRGANVNKYSEKSKSAWAKITEDMNEYNTMLGGKWNNIVNPFQKVESGSWDIMRNWKKDSSTAVSETVATLPYTDMGIAVENQQDINTAPVLEFSGYTKDFRFVDIFNCGTRSFDWKITSDKDWVIFNKTNGTVYDDDRIYAGIDWDKAPDGKSAAEITVTRYIGENAVQSKTIDVKVNNDIKELPEKTYAEANGYVSIEAEHFTASVENGSYRWQEQDDFGRSGTSMKLMPDAADSISDNSAYLEYDVNFESTGTFNVDVYRMPTLNERGSVNFALGIDEAAPTLLEGNNTYYNNSSGTDKWGKSILNNVEVLTAEVSISEKGIHKIRLYGVDTGVVIDKIVITTGEKHDSFYGAPESYNTTYNNGGTVTAGVVTGDAPKLITGKNVQGVGIIAVYKNDGTLSSIQTSENYSDGAYTFDKAVNPADGEAVKGMVWSSLEDMKPVSGVYGSAETGGNAAVMPEPDTPSTEITGEITALFEPKLYISEMNIAGDTVTDIGVIKTDSITNALITVAAYDADGIMLDENTITQDFSTAEINEKVSVPTAFDIPASAAELQTIIYDSRENLNALSPSYTLDTDTISLMALYDGGVIQIKSSLDNWGGKEAICRISDAETDETVYIRQETVKEDTFKNIKTGGLDGIYDVNIGVSGEGLVISEKAYTAQNITTDTPEASSMLYTWDFAEEAQVGTSGSDLPVVSGNAVYDSENQAIKMTSTDKTGGTVNISFDEPVKAAQGQKITVVSKIAYGRQSGKYMDYAITDSSGKELVKSHINMYSSSAAQSLQIGGAEQLESGLPAGIAETKIKNNSGIMNGYSTFSVTLDPDTNTITLVVSNAEGESAFTGKFPEGSSCDLGALSFSTTHTYASRSCYVDDISV
ncbi:MAG: glycosyl hydrolase 115 family protein, partial [Candidatus Ornithomonoglobus sp.]